MQCLLERLPDLSRRGKNITPFVFKNEMAPHLASRLEQMPIDISLIKTVSNIWKDVMNGSSPKERWFSGALKWWRLYAVWSHPGAWFSCLLVARAGLGTINHTLLTIHFARSAGLKIKGIIYKRQHPESMERDNVETIAKLAGVSAIIPCPRLPGLIQKKVKQAI